MSVRYWRLKRKLFFSLTTLLVMLCFQNCGGPMSTPGSKTSSSTTGDNTNTGNDDDGDPTTPPVTPPPPPPPVNPANLPKNLVKPVITNGPSANLTLYAGMGTLSGTVNVTNVLVEGNAGAGESGQTLILRCTSTNRDLDLECNNRVLDNGSTRFQIRPGDNRECLSGTTTVTYYLEDSVPTNPQAAILRSDSRSFPLTIVNSCLSEAKVYGSTRAATDSFGTKVKYAGNYLAVAAPNDDAAGTDAGAVHIYQKSGGAWTIMQKITVAGSAGHQIEVLDLNGSTLAIGDPVANNEVGQVHVYSLQSGTWVRTQTLAPTSPNSNFPEMFGSSVAIDGSTMAIGAMTDTTFKSDGSVDQAGAGSVFIYTNSGGSWTFAQKVSGNGAVFEEFGAAVALQGTRLVVGAPTNRAGYLGAGKLYVYEGSAGSFTRVAALDAGPGSNDNAEFASSVGLHGNYIVAGAPRASGRKGNTGAAYVYAHNNGTWAYSKKLQSSDGESDDEFGKSVSIYNDDIVVGSRRESATISRKGAAYHYRRNAANWDQRFKIMARDRANGDFFGSSVSVYNGEVVVGSPFDDGSDNRLSNSGAIYSYELK